MKDYYFIMNAGVKAGGEITHAVLEGKIVSAPKGYDTFTGIEAAREKLACGNIRQQMEEFGIELEIVPVNTDFYYDEGILRLLV
ncbi:charged multivesicular body protein 2b-B [Bacteroides fragilis]